MWIYSIDMVHATSGACVYGVKMVWLERGRAVERQRRLEWASQIDTIYICLLACSIGSYASFSMLILFYIYGFLILRSFVCFVFFCGWCFCAVRVFSYSVFHWVCFVRVVCMYVCNNELNKILNETDKWIENFRSFILYFFFIVAFLLKKIKT